MYQLLRAEIKKQVYLRGLSYADLAEMTGIKRSTISAFMCGVRNSDATASALARVLQIEM